MREEWNMMVNLEVLVDSILTITFKTFSLLVYEEMDSIVFHSLDQGNLILLSKITLQALRFIDTMTIY